ncbi:hypothetical protein PC116_g33175 [Phytophthora cactorum]|nr:hypothetical protein PC116_g33175 [Phytophthora cactorum]
MIQSAGGLAGWRMGLYFGMEALSTQVAKDSTQSSFLKANGFNAKS